MRKITKIVFFMVLLASIGIFWNFPKHAFAKVGGSERFHEDAPVTVPLSEREKPSEENPKEEVKEVKKESIPGTFNVSELLRAKGQAPRFPGGITKIIVDAIDLLVKLTGSLALIVFILGALLTVVSEGKEDRLEKGKTAMLYAIYGIVISLMAFIIVTAVQSLLF